MDIADATAWAATRKHAVLITIRQDGRPQSSDIVYGLDGDTFRVSVTDDRAKTTNMRRDPRVVLHLSEPQSWSYVSLDGTVELSDVTTEPGDATSDELCALYEQVSGGPHDDWDEYRRAMVEQKRLVVRFTPASAVGQVH
jgi:PPOX class probable F420-dependent enzyme